LKPDRGPKQNCQKRKRKRQHSVLSRVTVLKQSLV
jgi:hypothetical protein